MRQELTPTGAASDQYGDTVLVYGRDVVEGDRFVQRTVPHLRDTIPDHWTRVAAIEAGADTMERTVGHRRIGARACLIWSDTYGESVGWRTLADDELYAVARSDLTSNGGCRP